MIKCCLIFLIIVCIITAIIYPIVLFRHLLKYTGINQLLGSTSKLIIPQFNDSFTELSIDLRAYASAPNDTLKQKLFPWLFNLRKGNNSNLYGGEKNSKGIVICAGSNHFRHALIALKALELIKNELPIEIIFSTVNDLSLDKQHIFQKMFPNVNLIDLSSTAFNDSYLELRGWEIKPFAVLASQFEQVLLMDADVLFLEKPIILFENKYYSQTGTLFFYDRPGLSDRSILWIKRLLSKHSQPLPRRTQESGVVLIDKSRVYLGLLSTCKLNDQRERKNVTYKYLHGDKDTWWLGFHIIDMPYSFIPTMTASIGQITNKKRKNQVCGHILHMDERYRPIWWNGGTFKNRYVNMNDLLSIDGWLEEGRWNTETYACLTNYQRKAKEFNTHQKQLITNYIQITKQFFNESLV